MTRFRTTLLPIIVCLVALGVHADDRQGNSFKGWGSVIDPDRDCEITLKGDAVTFKLPGTAHDFAAELQRWNAPRILSDVTGDFIVEVKVAGEFQPSETSTIETRQPYNGGGLLLVKDRDNYVSLHRGAVELNGQVRQYANFELRKDAELAISRSELGLDDKDAYLRIERRGNKIFALASHDGIQWKSYEEPIIFDFPETAQLGVEVVNSSNKPFTCMMEGFTVFRKATDADAKR